MSFACPVSWRCACPHPLPIVSSASRRFVSLIVSFSDVLRAVGGASCSFRRGVSSSRLGERGGFCFSSYPGGERMSCGSCPAVPGLGRCLLVLMPSGDGAMPFSSSVFPPAPYHPMAAGHLIVRCPCLAHRRLLLVLRWLSLLPRAAYSIRGERDGRRDGWGLACVSACGSSCLVDECI